MLTSPWNASASRSISTTFPDLSDASGRRRRAGGTQARDACERRWMRIIERGVHRIGCQSAGVVPMQLDERRGELGRAGMAGGERVRLELVPARPQRGERGGEERGGPEHEDEQQQRGVRRGEGEGARRGEAGPPRETARP